jgi:septal ring factor EnvC (AmiA/AmiB activator)
MAALALTVQAPGMPPLDAHQGGRRLDRIEAEIRHKRQQIRWAQHREQGLLSRIARSDARSDSLARSIEDLALALRRARARLVETRAALAYSGVELRRWTRRLERRQSDLDAQREALGHRAATAYRMGTP